MKNKFQAFCNSCLKLIPVLAVITLTVCSNSTITWLRGQEELPAGAKKYRKF